MQRGGFVARHLDPESRLGEVLFGLIMVLSATLTASVVTEPGEGGVRQLLWAAIGCNIAWGIIDAVMYVMDAVSRRARNGLLLRRLRCATSHEEEINLVAQELGDRIGPLVSLEQQRAVAVSLLAALPMEPVKRPLLSRDDIMGAVACFWLVFLSCIPAAVPFLIFDQPSTALRVSNLVLIGMLFFVGQQWARHIGASRSITGIVTIAIGLLLVAIAILLGG